jgi:hypothetical protein
MLPTFHTHCSEKATKDERRTTNGWLFMRRGAGPGREIYLLSGNIRVRLRSFAVKKQNRE